MILREFKELDSTSTYVAAHASELESGTLVYTPCQLAGRGQRGNSWESEPGCNLTFTALMRPDGWEARRQFFISEAVAVAIASVLERDTGVKCSVKWPNDIYAHNPADGSVGKICGILISHSLDGSMIRHTLIGAGINVNQTIFKSDAPNPVSLKGITGRDYALMPLLKHLAEEIERSLEQLWHDPDYAGKLHDIYMSKLWRGDGRVYPWLDTATGEQFQATLYAVEPLGHLVLRTCEGSLRRYAFKEVVFV